LKSPGFLIHFTTIQANSRSIAYYDTFLTTLHELLLDTFVSTSDTFHVYGQSLAGFEDEPSSTHQRPYSLEEQISYIMASLTSQRILSGPKQGQPYSSIILIGHSVGSYILLEAIQQIRKASLPLKIRAGILLFPTVTHIAASPSGVKISTLFRIPRRASLMAKGLIALAPKRMLLWLVGFVTAMPRDAAEVTTRFLTSRIGIWQAL
jgi:alpha-beta hydrolase superfamily lysophospholipase